MSRLLAPFTRFLGALSLPQHLALLGFLAVCLMTGVAVAVTALGDPKAAGPRATAAIGPTDAGYAPRVSFADAAVKAPWSELAQASAPAVVVDPSLDAGVARPEGGASAAPPTVSALGGGGPSGSGPLAKRLGDLPPTLDLMPESASAAAVRATPLARAPIMEVHERSPTGLLPRIAESGRAAAQVYARPFRGLAEAPKIALVVGGLGFNARVTADAIAELPADVTLSFMPYTPGLQGWIDRARADGHEVLIELPMESWDPRGDDTGPQTLTVAGPAEANIARMEQILSRGAGYFGVMNYLGQRFVTVPEAAAPVVAALQRRGLAAIGNGIGARSAFGIEAARLSVGFAAADRVIDARRDAEAIADNLMALETLSQRTGAALGVGFAFPVTLEQIKVWATTLSSRGFALAPASAVIAARTTRR